MQRILVVDDNEDMVETLERLFSFYQYKVLKALNGKVAVEIAEKEQPDIIILDAHMPVMDGFTACRILKEKRKTTKMNRKSLDHSQITSSGLSRFSGKPWIARNSPRPL